MLAAVHGAAPPPPLPRVRPRVLQTVRRRASAARPGNRRARETKKQKSRRRARVRRLLRARLRGCEFGKDAPSRRLASSRKRRRSARISERGRGFGRVFPIRRVSRPRRVSPYERSVRDSVVLRGVRSVRALIGALCFREGFLRRRGLLIARERAKRSVGDAAPEPTDGVPQREDAHRDAGGGPRRV